MSKRLTLLAIPVLLTIGLGLWAANRSRSRSSEAVVTVQRTTIATTVQATGRVEADRQANLALRSGGRVLTVTVRAGDAVAAGDVLLMLGPSEAEKQVRQAEASLALRQIALQKARTGGSDDEIEAARARLQQAVVARQAAQAAYDKIASEEGAETSAEAVALARANAEERSAENAFRRAVHGAPPDEIASLEQQVTLAKIGINRAGQALAETRLLAPFSGIITEVLVREYETANPSQPLMTLADPATLLVVAQVDETDIRAVASGQRAGVHLDAFPGQVITGTVTHVAPAASSQRGATTFAAEIRLDSTAGLPLRPGMSADVTIVTAQREGVLALPRAAVQQVGSKEVVTLAEGHRQVTVVTGMTNDQQVEVVSGLQEGQQVLVTD